MSKINKLIFKDFYDKVEDISFGKYNSYIWGKDPKHLVFALSRYKFVSKLLNSQNEVLEVGAGDGFKSRIVDVAVKKLFLCDTIVENLNRYKKLRYNNNKYFVHDFCIKKMNKKFDAIYSLDVIEHIDRKKVNNFIRNINQSLKKNGVLIIGTPSKESQKYTGKMNKLTHVNVYSSNKLKKFLNKKFSNVFMFSMNDEVIHTGFEKMSNYLFALCIK